MMQAARSCFKGETTMTRWQVLKDGIPVAVCSSAEEADEAYLAYDADEIIQIDDDGFED